MKLALCIPFRNDEDMLSWTLQKIPMDYFADFIFLDTGSTDSSKSILFGHFPNAIFLEDKLEHVDFGKWRTDMLRVAEERGNDWVFMLDSDETMFEKDYALLHKWIESGQDTLYRVARIDFANDKEHYSADPYPDWQGRLIQCNKGYHFLPQTHAQACINGETIKGTLMPNVTLFHYGWTRDLKMKTLQYFNNSLTEKGLPNVKELPQDVKVIERHPNLSTWCGEQP